MSDSSIIRTSSFKAGIRRAGTLHNKSTNTGLSPDAVAGIVVDVLCLVAAAVAVAAVVIYRHKISKLGSHRRLGLPAMIAVVVGVLLVAAVCCYCFKKQIISGRSVMCLHYYGGIKDIRFEIEKTYIT
ncbi:hypothetical protein ROHU_009916 [Labeo rohita]|uniref:Uncharacterized protein n=1 Tax=Labeo rohita TaxID=84645 RepID=A0A498M084_LABRO|nr:hypothetical protein ROHU_009916 [Labeo rohita]